MEMTKCGMNLKSFGEETMLKGCPIYPLLVSGGATLIKLP